VYACREFEAKVHLSCHLESGSGPGYVDLAGVPVEWYLDGKYINTVKTDGLGWSWNRLHVAEPGAHVVRVVFRGLTVDDKVYGAAAADFTLPVSPPPTPAAPRVSAGRVVLSLAGAALISIGVAEGLKK
jgi:hypothetical protein